VKIAVAQLGARMHYAVPRIFEEAGCLKRLYTDICAVRGPAAWAGRLPQRFLPVPVHKMASRRVQGVPAAKIINYDALGLRYWWRLRRANTPREIGETHLWAGKEFARLILKTGWGEADHLYTFNSAAFGLLAQAKADGLRNIYEQTIVPVAVQIELLTEEQARWPKWEEATDLDNFFGLFLEKEYEEWALADRIICGSRFVLEGIRQAGGPADRAVVVNYGVEALHRPAGVDNSPIRPTDRPLRVLTVGTVCLRKGAPYVAEAARRLRGRAEFRIAGSIDLTASGRRKMAEAVELLGIVPRPEMPAHFEWADVFLLPSICEGSATASYEALAWGLPVITTSNAGAPVDDGIEGFIVPIRDTESICTALEKLIDQPGLRHKMSVAARVRHQSLSVAAYGQRLLKEIR
jgi:glycosyltransferase involved in cell wall biosynthesis